MSGIEAVGLILPLVLSALEHWNSCTRPFVRYKKFEREATDLIDRIEIEKTIFRNECRYLLGSVVEQDTVSGMLDSLMHSGWNNEDIDDKLAQHLDESIQSCLSIVKSINQHLQDISQESHKLREILQQQRQVRQDHSSPETHANRMFRIRPEHRETELGTD